MNTLQQRMAAVQSLLNAQSPVASGGGRMAPLPPQMRPATDDISQQSPQPLAQRDLLGQRSTLSTGQLDQLQTQYGANAPDESGSIELNGQVVDSGSPPSDAEFHMREALSTAFQQLRPLSQAHMLDAKTAQDVIGATVTDVTKDQLGVGRAARDIQALMQQRANGTLSDDAYEAALTQAKNGQAGYSFDQFIRAPGGAQMLGIQDQIKHAREQSLQSFAESHGWDRSEVKWDDKQNQPTPDYQAADFNFRRAQQKEIEAKMQHYPDKVKADQRQAAIENINRAMGHASKQLGDLQKSLSDPLADEQTSHRHKLQSIQLQNQIQTWNGQLQKLIGDDGLGNKSDPPSAPNPQSAVPAVMGDKSAIAVGSIDEAIAGARANKYPPGTILSLGGAKQRVTGNPAQPFEPVQ